eukprot:m.151435 g.151435  ORF g.151435 m.151435 type:complete len:59 (-) comp14249_c0_seq5:3839-4015(-)
MVLLGRCFGHYPRVRCCVFQRFQCPYLTAVNTSSLTPTHPVVQKQLVMRDVRTEKRRR